MMIRNLNHGNQQIIETSEEKKKMSGGVGPVKDIGLHKEEDEPQATRVGPEPAAKTGGGGRPWYLSFRHLNALSLSVILAASGIVSPWDIAFAVGFTLYMLFLSRVAFPPLGPGPVPPAFPNSRTLRLYVQLGAVIGLFLPIAYILEGFYLGDKEGVRAAAPHLFLLAAQIFFEGVAFQGGFSAPIRAFVPVTYNARRIFTIIDWLWIEFEKTEVDLYGASRRRRLHVGRGLAIANMAFWSFNLFGFLLPVYLPRVFKSYYSPQSDKAKD